MEAATIRELTDAFRQKRALPERVRVALHFEITDYGSIFVSAYPSESNADLFVHEIEIDVPQLGQGEIVEKQVAVLVQAKQKIQAETQAKLDNIDLTIRTLQAIEWKPE